MKLFLDTGNIKDIETYCAIGIIDGVTTNPSLMAKEPGDPREIIEAHLPDRQGPGQRRGPRHRRRGHDPRGARPGDDRPAHGRQGAVHARRACRRARRCAPRASGQRHAGVLGGAGAACRQGRGHVREPVRRPARRHRHRRHGAHPADRRDLPTTTSSRPRCSSPAPGTRCTSWQAARMGADICTCPPSVIEALFKHPLTDIGIDRFLKDWAAAKGAAQ